MPSHPSATQRGSPADRPLNLTAIEIPKTPLFSQPAGEVHPLSQVVRSDAKGIRDGQTDSRLQAVLSELAASGEAVGVRDDEELIIYAQRRRAFHSKRQGILANQDEFETADIRCDCLEIAPR